MNKVVYRNENGEIVTLGQAAARVNLGITTVRRLAYECGAALKIGRCLRIDMSKLVEYIKTFVDLKIDEQGGSNG